MTIHYAYEKKQANEMTYEELSIEGKKVFSYNFLTKKGDFSGLNLVNAGTLNTNSPINISVLCFIAFNANLEDNNPILRLMDFIKRMLWFRSVSDGNHQFINFKPDRETLTNPIIRNNKVKLLEHFFTEHDVHLKLDVRKNVNGEDVLMAVYTNGVMNFFEIASHGTRALLLYFYWLQQFKNASFIFIDEVDAFFHTEVAEKLILSLAKEAMQVLITTHNTNLMTNQLLRPDCYFVIAHHTVFSLPYATERELREGHNLEKLYLSGPFNVE